ncbi:MAG: DUF262 domain-containing protein [Sedimentisphaeraceae bacterium JB056]
MATWKSETLKDVIVKIEQGDVVLPVIQRELVWKQDKMVSLFETILKGDSFGGIMTVIDPANKVPLFEFRKFNKDYIEGQLPVSSAFERLDKETTYVIDGQQRLSAFYIGLKGTYNHETLFIDLLSEYEHNDFVFYFAKDFNSLPSTVDTFSGEEKRKPQWYSAAKLYSDFEYYGYDHSSFSDSLINGLNNDELSDEDCKRIEKVLYKFQVACFTTQIVGMCGVPIDRKDSKTASRLKIVRLFQKLNQGGTILTGLELMRSVFKAYNADNETFLNNVRDEFIDIGFNQDEIIKFVFLLQDNSQKDIVHIDKKDSDFIQHKGDRLRKSLVATREFLKNSKLYEYCINCRPSIIPLTFVAYHLFHSNVSDENLANYFDNSETRNESFHTLKRWLIVSYLNNVFRRGNGWVPEKTGRNKILNVIKDHKGECFPIEKIFDVYRNHSLHIFDEDIKDSWERLNWYDRRLVIYMIYGRPDNFRQNDIDHIHPKSVLSEKGYDWSIINNLGNYQYLYFSDNRSKQATEFGDWIENVFGADIIRRNDYLRIHNIPSDETLWNSDNFEPFLEARRQIIFDKLRSEIYG